MVYIAIVNIVLSVKLPEVLCQHSLLLVKHTPNKKMDLYFILR